MAKASKRASVLRVANRYLERQGARFDGVDWVDANILAREMRQELESFTKTLIREGQKVANLYTKRAKQALGSIEGGDQVTGQHELVAVKRVLRKMWGDDAMLGPLARLIARGDYIF